MSIVKCFLIIVFITLGLDEVFSKTIENDKIDPLCLGCLCEAASNCDRNLTCASTGACGLFGIHKPFWIDGGSNVVGNDNPDSEEAWVHCARDVVCAAKTVTTYMFRYQRDCNNDGKIDCIDIAWIHKLGAEGCVKRPKNSSYEHNLIKCLSS